MKITKMNSIAEIESNLDGVLAELKHTLLNELTPKQAKVLIYWLNDWNQLYLTKEKEFDPKKLIKYKKGNIAKVDLGYNIGSEQGGLHYGLILDNDNIKQNKVVTVIPLRSLKDGEDPKNLKGSNYELYLGHAILTDKITENINKRTSLYENKTNIQKFIDDSKSEISKLEANTEINITDQELKIKKLNKNIHKNIQKIISINRDINKINKDLDNLQKGSVALVSQIKTISKQRIFEPTRSSDSLANFELDSKNMKNIELMIKKLYLSE